MISTICKGLLFFYAIMVPLQTIEGLERFIVVTPPKAGTHLLTKAVEELTGKRCCSIFSTYKLSHDEWASRLAEAERGSAFIQMHALPYGEQIASLKALGYKVLFLIRDPRDQALSLLFFIQNKHWSLGPLSMDKEPYRSLSFEDKLYEIITGKRTGFSGVQKLFRRYLPWAFYGKGFVLMTRYEDLVGAEGGGSQELQLEAMKKISLFLNLKLTDAEIASRSKNIYGTPGEKTFRKGKIGEWRKYFKPRHLHEINERFGHEMSQVGYR